MSLHAKIEHELLKLIQDYKLKEYKVSRYFIHAKTKKLIKQIMLDKADNFKARNGWFHRFYRHKAIVLRKRKSREKSCKCNLNLVLNVSTLHNYIY